MTDGTDNFVWKVFRLEISNIWRHIVQIMVHVSAKILFVSINDLLTYIEVSFNHLICLYEELHNHLFAMPNTTPWKILYF